MIEVITDASGAVGFGAICQNSWMLGVWPPRLVHVSIAVKEIVPVVIALHIWTSRLSGRCVRVVSDNMSVVCAVNAQSCRDSRLMGWVRRMFLLCVLHNIQVSAVHVGSKANACADALSRGLPQRFRVLMPSADREPTPWDWSAFGDLL